MTRDYNEKLFDFFVAESGFKDHRNVIVLFPLLHLEREKIVYGGYYSDRRYARKWNWENII